jgi:hypothetical protein
MNIVRSSSSCCKLSLHSRSASESGPSSSSEVAVSVEGNESTSSDSLDLGGEGSLPRTEKLDSVTDMGPMGLYVR